MSLIFLESFDGIATADMPAKGWTAGGATVSSAHPRTGANGLFVGDNNKRTIKGVPASAESDTFIAGFAAYLPTLTDTDYGLCVLSSDGGTVGHTSISVLSTGALKIRRYQSADLGFSGAGVITAGTQCYVEFKAKLHDSAGTVDVHVNGVSVLSLTGLDTKNGGTKAVYDSILLGGFGSFGGTGLYLDDLYLANNAGTVNNDFIGDSRVRCLLPSGTGNSSQLVGSDADSVNNYALVDEAPPSAADYVESATTGDKDTYTFTDLPDVSGAVAGVQVSALAMKTDAGARTLAVVTRHAGGEHDSADLALPTVGPAYVAEIQNENPVSTSAWTRADVNAAEFGVKVRP